jgi:hypothetical protein
MGTRCVQSVCIRSLIFKKPAEYRDFAKAFVTFAVLLVARDTLKCNFIYVPKYSMAFAAPIFTKRTNAQQRCVPYQISPKSVNKCGESAEKVI